MTDTRREVADAPAPLVVADLPRADRTMISAEGTDLTEAKEAIVDGLLALTFGSCSGEGPEGRNVFGQKPSARFVTGFLLPRFDDAGDDDTSDIHLATMGLDLQLAAGTEAAITVRPELSIYVRELPAWEDISDPRHDMMPQIALSKAVYQQVEAIARTIIDTEVAALPPADLDEPDDRAGDAVAAADVAREAADIAADEAANGDAEARGIAQAAQTAADRAERSAAASTAATERRRQARRERQRTVSAIRAEAFDRAFQALGITVAPTIQGNAARTLTAEDLVDPETSDAAAPTDDAEETAPPEEPGDAEGPPPAGAPLGPLRPGVGRIEDRHAQPQPLPQKWRRFELPLAPLRLDALDRAARDAACAAFAADVGSAVDQVLAAWLSTEDGQRDAFRKGETVLPSQFADETAWNGYLDGLRSRRPALLVDVKPDLNGVSLVADVDPDFVDPTRWNVRIALENNAAEPARRDRSVYEHGIFQTRLTISVPEEAHRPLRLDRVKPSYRFRDWLEYPAMGLNCGVEAAVAEPGEIGLRTTWMPRYTQPRIDAREVPGVPTNYAALADPVTPLESLLALSIAYDAWIEGQAGVDVTQGLERDAADQELAAHADDIEAYRRESGFIRDGISLLAESQSAARTVEAGGLSGPALDEARQRAVPYLAWLHTNETFARYGGTRFTDWRLFQLAFILAHVPTLASRMPAFADRFDADRDELSASLLYFPTGGGKSEAFFGLLIYNLFLDRLRGKRRGVTALVRYPLRLLTLQQARRLMRILVHAELVRLGRGIDGWPFEIGFWVGSGNTPNRAAQGFGGVPPVTMQRYPDDSALLAPPQGSGTADARARRRSLQYREALESYDKLRVCPACGADTGMRRYPNQHGRIGIVCFNDADCAWNLANPPRPVRVPLPFLLTDDTIYQRAPSVVLGTVDKLALIGQHDRTANAVVGMFGAARYVDPASGHLFMPRTDTQIDRAEQDGWRRVRPAFSTGEAVFHDPFPSLLIQDEGHLLDESLGTFSGLFETTFERILLRLGGGILSGEVARWQIEGADRPRLAKVIAATATISDPDRQLRVLYQREPLRFPSPGPSLYQSFYSAPREPRPPERAAQTATLQPRLVPERASPRMRVYVSMMTNGRSHTMTTSAVVSAYHLAFTGLWQALAAGDAASAVDRLATALPPHDPLTNLRATSLRALVGQPDLLATLLDLQRISLTYVTNKKGGDQIIETLVSQVDRDQRSQGLGDLPFLTDLISGGVTIAEIQDVMRRADGVVAAGSPFPPVEETLRNIVATSAISHGVDVDKFNAMFFAGLPADIAEYIQASSRVGRTHVGFSMLVPTPHSRRDRYVVETHDQFHRFLERMIPPPAVQRWADRAIRRIVPSVMQAFLCGVVEQEEFHRMPDADKRRHHSFRSAAAVKSWADRHAGGSTGAIRALSGFALEAIGVEGRGPDRIGAAPHLAHYRDFVQERVRVLLEVFTYRSDAAALANFWSTRENPDVRKPMTSLRDVDAGGIIQASTRDPWRERGVHLETVRQVMRIIRGQRHAVRADVDADPVIMDTEDAR